MINYAENKGENWKRSLRYDINRTRPRHGYEYTKISLEYGDGYVQ